MSTGFCLRCLCLVTLLLSFHGDLSAATATARTGIQDARYQAPVDFYPGLVAFYGKVTRRNPGGDAIDFKVASDWGAYTYRVTRTSAATGVLPLSDDLLPRRQPGPLSGDLAWEDLSRNEKLADCWLEGELLATGDAGKTLTGRFRFQHELAELRFELIDAESGGPKPAPTFRNVAYGPHFRQALDVYLAKSKTPTPVVVYVHGGGWTGRDKSELKQFQAFLDVGISVISINYRLVPPANPDGATPAVAWPLHDAARAVQFIRSRAIEWNLIKSRLALWGESAGACSALWLATHADLAEPAADDEVARESTRPTCVAALIPQTSLDPQQMREWVGPELTYGPQAFAVVGEGDSKARFEAFLAARARLLPWINEYSPAALLTREGPPLFLDYRDRSLVPRAKDTGYYTHSPRFGIGFHALAQRLGRECYLKYDGLEATRYFTWQAFVVAQLVQ